MTVEPKGRTGTTDEITSGSLEPTDAWIGLELSGSPSQRPAPDPVYAPSRSRGGFWKITIVALLAGVGGAWFAGGSTNGPPPEVGFDQSTGAVPAPVEDGDNEDDEPKAKANLIQEVQGKRTALEQEIEQLKARRTEQQEQLSALEDRRSDLNKELEELERRRQEQLKQLSAVEAGDANDNPAPDVSEFDPSPPGEGVGAAAVPASEPEKQPEPEEKPKPEKTAEEPRNETEEARKAAAETAKREEERKAEAEKKQSEEAQRKAREDSEAEVAPASDGSGAEEQESEESLQKRLFGFRSEEPPPPRKRPRIARTEPDPEPEPVSRSSARSEPDPEPEPASRSAARSEPAPSRRSSRRSGRGQRVYVQFQAGDPDSRDRAHALADRLQARGYNVVELRAVRRMPRGRTVRYVHARDRAARRPPPRDFSDYPVPPADIPFDPWFRD